jgi:hypothetical protein
MKKFAEYRREADTPRLADLPPAPARNPFAKGRQWNLSEQFLLERRDPALAARLKALAE